MTSAFDPRLVKVGIKINGVFTYFQDLDIRVQGQRFFSETSAFCTIKISNLTRDQRHWLLTNATPVLANNITPAYITVDVGRQSYGTFRLFEGTCYTSTVTQPPDIGITFRSLDSSGLASAIQPTSFGPVTKLSVIAQYVALNLNPPVNLDFRVTNDIQVANFSTTTNTNDLVPRLNQIGGIVACVNNGNLVVRDINGFNQNRSFTLDVQHGMVGLPQATESGCIAQMLVQPNVQIGDLIKIVSVINPSVNGEYRISQIAFDIANRDNPFFYTLTLTNKYAPSGATP
jgi:hypothetical protein